MIALLLLLLQDAPVLRMEEAGEREYSRKLDGIEAMAIGAGVLPKSSGKQTTEIQSGVSRGNSTMLGLQ